MGAANNVSSHLCYHVLSITGHVLARATVRRVTDTELQDPTVQAKIADFDRTINASLVIQLVDDLPPLPDLETDDEPDTYNDTIERDDVTEEAFDKYLNAELNVDRGGEVLSGTVKRRKRDVDGTLVGTPHENPMLDTREYIIELNDGSEEIYAANTIAINMYSIQKVCVCVTVSYFRLFYSYIETPIYPT